MNPTRTNALLISFSNMQNLNLSKTGKQGFAPSA